MAWPTELYYDFLITGCQHETSHDNGTTEWGADKSRNDQPQVLSDHGTPSRVVWIRRMSTLSIDGPRTTRLFDTNYDLLTNASTLLSRFVMEAILLDKKAHIDNSPLLPTTPLSAAGGLSLLAVWISIFIFGPHWWIFLIGVLLTTIFYGYMKFRAEKHDNTTQYQSKKA